MITYYNDSAILSSLMGNELAREYCCTNVYSLFLNLLCLRLAVGRRCVIWLKSRHLDKRSQTLRLGQQYT